MTNSDNSPPTSGRDSMGFASGDPEHTETFDKEPIA